MKERTAEDKAKTAKSSLEWYHRNREKVLARKKLERDTIQATETDQERLVRVTKSREKDRLRRPKRKGKQSAEQKKRYATDVEFRKARAEYNLQVKYGIDRAKWREMFAAQGGKCPVCDDVLRGEEMVRPSPVDHCHVSDRVRGLLCSRCNRALGCVGDSIEILERLIAYLRRCPTLGGIEHDHSGPPLDPLGVTVKAMLEARRRAGRS